MNVKKTQGFTLVEMLVVIAIIAILAAALFPAISSAIESARAVAVKNKGRSIWTAVISANSEREIHDMTALWAGDLIKKDSMTFTDAEAYFNYLMSDGVTVSTIEAKIDNRVVGDLKPSMLTAPGITAIADGQAGSLAAGNNAWHVAKIEDSYPAEVPFLITRNVDTTKIAWANTSVKPDATDAVEMNAVDPFQGKRAVWVTKGGSTTDARKIIMRTGRINPAPIPSTGTDAFAFLKSNGGAPIGGGE